MLFIVIRLDRVDFGTETLWDHFVFQVPPSKATQLGHDDVTIAKQIDIKIDMTNGLDIRQLQLGC